MGYGHRANSLLGFSWQHGISDFSYWIGITSQRYGPNSHRDPPTRLPGDYHRPGSPTLLRPPSAIRQQLGQIVPEGTAPTSLLLDLARTRWYWNIDQLCIDYAFRPRLSSRLTLGGLAFPRNPWAFGGGVSHPSLATHACILTRVASTAGSLRRFDRHTTLPYPSTHLATGSRPVTGYM